MMNNDSKKYLENFYDPQFSAYDFMILFSTINAIKDVRFFDRDSLLNYIIEQKKLNQYSRILREIHLKSNGIYSYSNDFDEAISNLKMAGILSTISPERDSSIYISENLDVSGMIQPRVEYVNELLNFVNGYQKYEIQRIATNHSAAYNQEDKDIAGAVLCLRKINNIDKK